MRLMSKAQRLREAAFQSGAERQAPALAQSGPPFASISEITAIIGEHLTHGGQPRGLPSCCALLSVHPAVQEALAELYGLGFCQGTALVLLAWWRAARGNSDLLVRALCSRHLETMDRRAVGKAARILNRRLGRLAPS